MNIHEYQAKEILRKLRRARAARQAVRRRAAAAEAAARSSARSVVVVKAQVHAGGRGKGGGVKVVKAAAEAREIAAEDPRHDLVTHQTGPEGKLVQRVLVERAATSRASSTSAWCSIAPSVASR